MRHFLLLLATTALAVEPVAFKVQLDKLSDGFDGKTCWVHPRAGALPGATPSVVLTMQKLRLTGSDIFYALNEMRTDDLGGNWSGPTEHATLGRRPEADGGEVGVCDFWPKWHAKTRTLLGTGHTVRYVNDNIPKERARETAYSIYDAEARSWKPWTALEMPGDARFHNAGAGCTQRVDLPDGDILLPIYFKTREQKQYRTAVMRCGFDGKKLTYRELGNELVVPIERGLYEPSLTKFGGRFYLTLRNDRAGYVATSDDGLHFTPPRVWCWDDGTELGNYNTQQHWVAHSDGLFLVYTRTGAGNDHVFRHRAPLFIAQVDPERLVVLRATERVLVPEHGARLGNFGVTEVNEHETWVTVAEWMQTWGPKFYDSTDMMKRGANNAVFAARIIWEKPNAGWDRR
ncbi:MAG: exo-alpha-sialidase [Chthoniobacteraceae bacterium]